MSGVDRAGLLVLVACVAASGGAVQAENIDPAGDGSRFAWAENVGWLNAEPSGDGGPGVQVGDFALTGRIWGENVGWISLSCEDAATCGAAAYGVSNDGAGVLSGFAWAENVGWINFAPVGAGVSIDPATGGFSGRAWGENIGWITFASAGPVPYAVRTGWCRTTPAPPAGASRLRVHPAGAGGATALTWTGLPDAGWYEVVQGDLHALRAANGDFAVGTTACLADNLVDPSLEFVDALDPGEASFYLSRGVNCKGKGTYDTIAQLASRDAGIAASGNDCP